MSKSLYPHIISRALHPHQELLDVLLWGYRYTEMNAYIENEIEKKAMQKAVFETLHDRCNEYKGYIKALWFNELIGYMQYIRLLNEYKYVMTLVHKLTNY